NVKTVVLPPLQKHFEFVYKHIKDFYSLSLFSSRPGRPPKRSLGMSMQDGSRLLPHSVHGLLSPSLLSHTVVFSSCSLPVLAPVLFLFAFLA
ncbi:dachshund a isoform X1, partial [Tachysurus ichikawai]